MSSNEVGNDYDGVVVEQESNDGTANNTNAYKENIIVQNNDEDWIDVDDQKKSSKGTTCNNNNNAYEEIIAVQNNDDVTQKMSNTSTTNNDNNAVYKEINILQEASFVSESNEEFASHNTGGDDDDDDNKENDGMQQFLQKHVEPLQKGLEEHVEKFEEGVEKLRARVDENVRPHLTKVGESMKGLQENTAKGIRDIHSNTARSIDELGKNTAKAIDAHVTPKVQAVQRGTYETFQAVATGTASRVEAVKKGTSDAVAAVSTNTEKLLDERVRPGIDALKTQSSRAINTASESFRETYHEHVVPHAHKVKTGEYDKYYRDTAPALFDENEQRWGLVLAQSSLMSFGQVLFCPNAITGAFVVVAMVIANPVVGMSSLACVLATNAMLLLGNENTKPGDFGRNAVVAGAGCAALVRCGSGAEGFFRSVVLGALLVAPMTLFVHLKLTQLFAIIGAKTTLLLPSNIVIVVVLLSATLFWDETMISWPVLAETTKADGGALFYRMPTAVLDGVSAIFFLPGNWWFGLLVLVGVFLCSRFIAGALLLGSFTGSLLGWIFGASLSAVNTGVSGYQAALTAAALAYYLEPKLKNLVMVVVPAVFWTCLLEAFFGALFFRIFGMALTLTMAFSLATLAVLACDTEHYFGLKRIPPESLSTPERYTEMHLGGAPGLEEQPTDAETDEEEGGSKAAIEKPLDLEDRGLDDVPESSSSEVLVAVREKEATLDDDDTATGEKPDDETTPLLNV